MKGIKKALSLLAAAALTVTTLMGSATITSAATVTDNTNLENHSYVAYQILKGDQTKDENGAISAVLTNPEWGSGIAEEVFLADLKLDETVGANFTDVKDAAGFAEKMADYGDNSTEAKAVAQIAYNNKAGSGTKISAGTTALDAGYYLIVDETDLSGTTDDVLNASILYVTDSITLADKTTKPTVEKKVKENTTNEVKSEEYGDQYNDVADYHIGDAVPFKLIGTVPDTAKFNKYLTYTFTDTLDEGLTAPDAAKVNVFYATTKSAESGTDLKDYFEVSVSGQTITVSLKSGVDLKALETAETPIIASGNYIIVTYEATLNKNAKIGLPGNENKVKLTYSSNPNFNGDGTPKNPDDTEDTKEDEVIVFTYELDTTKVSAEKYGEGDDQKPRTLAGAEFVLLNADKTETVTIGEDNKVTGWAKVTQNDENENVYAAASTLTSGSQGVFKVKGLDEGTYYLRETKAPKDYNLLKSDIEVVITATTTNGQTYDGTPEKALTKLDVTANGIAGTTDEIDKGIAKITVENRKGSTLPSTGGMGTRIFLLVGIIALVAGIALKSRRYAKNG